MLEIKVDVQIRSCLGGGLYEKRTAECNVKRYEYPSF